MESLRGNRADADRMMARSSLSFGTRDSPWSGSPMVKSESAWRHLGTSKIVSDQLTSRPKDHPTTPVSVPRRVTVVS